jgi:hypothetical protein
MKSFITIIFLFAFMACNQKKKHTSLLITDDLKYSAYSWHLDDTILFYLAHYIDIDKNGHYLIMRHDTFMDKPKYFEGDINDTLKNLINKTFVVDGNFEVDYSSKPEDNFIYDGFTYCFDYKKADSNDRKIQFIPEKSPEQIIILSQFIDTLIYSATSRRESFNTEDYKKELIKFALQISEPLPKPIHANLKSDYIK